MFGAQAFADITLSAHDFSAAAWNSTGEMCVTCHTPHNAGGAATGPLWNHTFSGELAYSVYTSPNGTLDAVAGQPSGASKLCLSCHDGTVALESFGGNGAVTTTLMGAVNPLADVGTNLSDDHPISISYAADTSLAGVGTAVTVGDLVTKTGTIGSELVPGGTVECSSCHDVHNTYTFAGTPLLRLDPAGSTLCLTCHAK
ncbi:MAG: cytochrome c3 family protein [Gammaproteobacteria bacterium]|nr:cytochrome c3 family protein [Gammaproteobacteria bacterium]